MVYLVTYDLRTPNDTSAHYVALIKGIKKLFPTAHRIERSVWLLDAAVTAAEVLGQLQPLLSPGDALFVAPLGHPWAGVNLEQTRSRWLEERGLKRGRTLKRLLLYANRKPEP